MDLMRRFGSGELSEILGEDLLKVDREQRILGLRAVARKSLETAGERDRTFFDAYARGVNAYIGTHGNRLPIEFRILHYAPKPWLAEDSVVIANQMVKDLNYHYFYDALNREKILAKLGPELIAGSGDVKSFTPSLKHQGLPTRFMREIFWRSRRPTRAIPMTMTTASDIDAP